WAQRLFLAGAILAGVMGGALLLIQGLLLAGWCAYCVTVDVLAIVLGLAALLPSPLEPLSTSARWVRGGWVLGIVLAIAGPLGWARLQPPPPPPPVPGP